MFEWKGRCDPNDGKGGLRWHEVVEVGGRPSAESVSLLGFASDEGVRRNQGRVGAAKGPNAIRQALCNLPVHQPIKLIDLGDVECLDGDLEAAQARYADKTAHAEGLTIGLGGGHEIAWASYQGLRLACADSKIGILNFDAHFDLRQEDQATSGTSFLAALKDRPGLTEYSVYGISLLSNTRALFETAERHAVRFLRDDELTLAGLEDAKEELADWIRGIDELYLSLDMDVFPGYLAPGVSAPAAYGVIQEVIEALIGVAARSGKLRLADVAELNPAYDIDGRTARLAAREVWLIANAWLETRRAE